MYFFILGSTIRTLGKISLACKIVSRNGNNFFALGAAEVVKLSSE
jgi:hypothetical protein